MLHTTMSYPLSGSGTVIFFFPTAALTHFPPVTQCYPPGLNHPCCLHTVSALPLDGPLRFHGSSLLFHGNLCQATVTVQNNERAAWGEFESPQKAGWTTAAARHNIWGRQQWLKPTCHRSNRNSSRKKPNAPKSAPSREPCSVFMDKHRNGAAVCVCVCSWGKQGSCPLLPQGQLPCGVLPQSQTQNSPAAAEVHHLYPSTWAVLGCWACMSCAGHGESDGTLAEEETAVAEGDIVEYVAEDKREQRIRQVSLSRGGGGGDSAGPRTPATPPLPP